MRKVPRAKQRGAEGHRDGNNIQTMQSVNTRPGALLVRSLLVMTDNGRMPTLWICVLQAQVVFWCSRRSDRAPHVFACRVACPCGMRHGAVHGVRPVVFRPVNPGRRRSDRGAVEIVCGRCDPAAVSRWFALWRGSATGRVMTASKSRSRLACSKSFTGRTRRRTRSSRKSRRPIASSSTRTPSSSPARRSRKRSGGADKRLLDQQRPPSLLAWTLSALAFQGRAA